MINLVCFPHYTAGGLLCDIMSDTFSDVADQSRIDSTNHDIGKLEDTDTVLTNYDYSDFLTKIKNIPDNTWAGTHCWPGSMIQHDFNQIITITTTTYRSKCYRWLRAYHHYFAKKWEPFNLTAEETVDKIRETAKNYLIPFEAVFAPNVLNIEFADIVENTPEFLKIAPEKNIEKHLARWQQLNHFLYDTDLWNTELIKIFYQAETEINLKRYYIYE